MKSTIAISILFIFCLILTSCSSNDSIDKKSERALMQKYSIKSISEYVSPINLGIPEKERIDHVRFFNQNGLFTREIRYFENGSIDFICNYSYDKKGNIIQAKTVKPDSSLVADIQKKYNLDNLMTEQYCYEISGGPYLYRNTFEYDSLKRLIDCHWYWPTGLKAIEKYYYDGTKKTQCVNYGPHNQFLFRWIYKYDDHDNLLESVEYYPDSLLKSKIICQYNQTNNMVRKTNYIEERMQQMATYEYDKRGLMSSKIEYSPSGKVSAKYRYHYEYY